MVFDHISRVRQFNRSAAVEIGALEESFLSRGRPLGVARVLNAIGHGVENVADIRAKLDLDTGLLSRLLRSLEKEGLIETNAHPEDGRSRIARLTPAGADEFAVYEKLSDERAAHILARHKNADHILEAMDILAIAFSRDQIVIEEVDCGTDAAFYCMSSYAADLSQRFGRPFELNKSNLPDMNSLRPPVGAFLLARIEDRPIGCVGLKGDGSEIAEIKRLWVAPAARGLGLARDLMTAAENAARCLGVKTLRLDTNSKLPEAVQLYRRDGWTEIDRFNDDPNPDLFFEKPVSD